VPKERNVDCHFQTNYSSVTTNCSLKSELGKKKVNELKSKLSAQLSLFVGHTIKNKNGSLASCKLLTKEEEEEAAAAAASQTDADCLSAFLEVCCQASDYVGSYLTVQL
jgi:hypothetical protein